MGRRAAIEHAAGVRLRPILMTTAAMVVAMVPLMVAARRRRQEPPRHRLVIAFGMSIGTMFTLFVTPAVYTFIARDHSRGRTPRRRNEPVRLEPHRAAAE